MEDIRAKEGYIGNKRPWSLKIQRDSHGIIKKSSSPTSRSVSSLVDHDSRPHHHHHQQRAPVIIYTHSPKVIHTQPKDFMALVQKLTGMSRSKGVGSMDRDVDLSGSGSHMVNKDYYDQHVDLNPIDNITSQGNNSNISNDDNESSSIITVENCSSPNTGDAIVGQLNSCVGSPFFEPLLMASHPNSLITNLPFFNMRQTPISLLYQRIKKAYRRKFLGQQQ